MARHLTSSLLLFITFYFFTEIWKYPAGSGGSVRDQEDSFCCWFGHRAFALTSLGHVPAPVPQFPSLALYLPYLVKITGGMRGSFLGIVEPQICRGFCMAGECRCCCKECQPVSFSSPALQWVWHPRVFCKHSGVAKMPAEKHSPWPDSACEDINNHAHKGND